MLELQVDTFFYNNIHMHRCFGILLIGVFQCLSLFSDLTPSDSSLISQVVVIEHLSIDFGTISLIKLWHIVIFHYRTNR